MKMRFKKLRDDAVLPCYKTAGALGMDLSLPMGGERYLLEPGEVALIPLGYQIEIPSGFAARIRPRSSFYLRGWGVAGEIDEDYRGELGLMLKAPSAVPDRVVDWKDALFGYSLALCRYVLLPGARVAQMIPYKTARFDPVWAEELSQTERGSGGFGSTGAR